MGYCKANNFKTPDYDFTKPSTWETRRFTIITDHRSLTYLFGIKDASSQLMRCRLQLSEYDYEIIYRAEAQHSNADCLSRIRLVQSQNPIETINYNGFLEREKHVIIINNIIESKNSIKMSILNENFFFQFQRTGY